MNEINLPPLPNPSIDEYPGPVLVVAFDDDHMHDYAMQAVTEDRARRDAEHLAELAAYELTVANLREQLALPETVEVLLCDFCGCETPDPWHGSTETDHHIHACDACKPKLWASQAPQAQRGEPVAWKWRFADGDLSESPFESRSECERNAPGSKLIPLYTHPQTPQVQMTEDEIWRSDAIMEVNADAQLPIELIVEFVRAVEAHHGIKEQPGQHPDDQAVDRFAVAMKAKLAVARAKGRGGWDDPAQCTVDHLSNLLHSHVAKGDPVDVANFAMMLHQRGSGIKEQS